MTDLSQIRPHPEGERMMTVSGLLSQRFFDPIFGEAKGLVEIRCLPSKEQLFSRDRAKIEAFIGDHIGENVYFGVCTRKGNDGSKGGVKEISTFWADIDWKDLPRGKAEADDLIKKFPLKPSMLVESGHGYHPYWILNQPEEACPEMEGLLKGITKALKGDRSAAELARILRVPETFNYKDGEKILATLRPDNGLRYTLNDFEPWRVEVPEKANRLVNFSEASPTVDIDQFKLSPRVKDLILKGCEGNGYKSRSEADEAVITALLSKGATDDQIRSIFQSYPIGEKYRETGGTGDQYLAHSISSAAGFLSAKQGGKSFLPNPPPYTPRESEEVKNTLIWAKDVPPPTEGEEIESLWGPFLFPSSLHTLAGDAGLGKSTLLYNVAVHLARGEVFGGFKPPRPLRVLYYDLETPDLLFRRKLHLISENSPP